MRALKLGLAAATLICTLSMTAQAADCKKIGSVGEAVGYDVAKLFATNGLKNIIAGQGRVGKGAVQTSCKTSGATTTCRASQTACKGGAPKACLGAWLCL